MVLAGLAPDDELDFAVEWEVERPLPGGRVDSPSSSSPTCIAGCLAGVASLTGAKVYGPGKESLLRSGLSGGLGRCDARRRDIGTGVLLLNRIKTARSSLQAGSPPSTNPVSVSEAADTMRAVSAEPAGILVLDRKIGSAELARLVAQGFGDMVKYVVDVRERIVAIGGELHADAEQLLLARGSRQPDLWGANYYPGRGPDGCVEFTALINIRPAQGNRSMEVQDTALRSAIREITFALVGEGEPLP